MDKKEELVQQLLLNVDELKKQITNLTVDKEKLEDTHFDTLVDVQDYIDSALVIVGY